MSEEPVISTKDRPGDFDALETAKDGEPIFVLQGGDPHAPPTVGHWASLFRAAALLEPNDEKREAMLRKATNAEAVAWAMQEYQRGYQPDQTVADDLAAVHADDEKTLLARLADRLYNALSEANDVAEALTRNTGVDVGIPLQIEKAVNVLKDAAAGFEPRRHLQGERAE